MKNKTVGRLVAIVFLVFLVNSAARAGVPTFPTPATEFKSARLSQDGRITVYFVPKIHGIPNPERFADMWKVVDKHFLKAARRKAYRMEIHYLRYDEFLASIESKFPGGAASIVKGFELIQAYTYIKADSVRPTIVIETYQPVDDNTFVHELLHHYFEQMTTDGTMNSHQLIPDYATHVESLMRFMLGKLY